jgi:hypothetical protein
MLSPKQSFIARAHQTFLDLLHTPLLPPPPGRPAPVELASIDTDTAPRSSLTFTSTPSPSPADSYSSPFDSIQSSIELDPSQAECVREMVSAPCRRMLAPC